jgi:hypothetical protein
MSRIEKAIIYIGLGLAFLKTGEAMVAYAPRAVFGWSSEWVSYLWAYLGAFMVEGVLYVAYHKLTTAGKDRNARVAAWAVGIIAVVFSLTMNKLDQMITDRTLGTLAGADPLMVLHNVVFAIPLIGAVLFMLMDIIDKATPDSYVPGRQTQPNRQLQRTQPSQHNPVAQWKGVQVSEAPLSRPGPSVSMPLDGPDEDLSVLLGGGGNSRKFQTDHSGGVSLVSRKHPETID